MIDHRYAPLADPDRIAAIAGYDLFNPELRRRLDEISRRSAVRLGMPMGMVSIVLDGAQFFVGSHGLRDWIAAAEGTPVEWSFCGAAVLTGAVTYVVPDAAVHPAHRDSPLVTREGVRAYAGAAITDSTGHALGMHCVVGIHPREFNGAELVSLCAEADQILATLGEYPARNAAPGPR